MKLSGNTILITGGTAGIGLAFATRFKSLGNQVIVTGRDSKKLGAARDLGLETFTCDVSDPEAIGKLARELAERHPKLNVLMNNAGGFISRNLTRGSDDLRTLTSEIDTNFSGTVRMTAALVGRIIQNKGTIINVSSGLAFVPLMVAPIYCATKAAVHSYSVSLRQQLKREGVEVVELAPPAVKTELTAGFPDDNGFKMMTTEELVNATLQGIRGGKTLICPGQSKQLRFMSRLAPGFIEGQLEKGSRAMIDRAGSW